MKKLIPLIQTVILEFFPRLFSDNPVFFKAVQAVAFVAGIIAKAPELLTSAGISCPALVHPPYSGIIAVAAGIVLFIAQLPNVSPAAPVVPEAVVETPEVK